MGDDAGSTKERRSSRRRHLTLEDLQRSVDEQKEDLEGGFSKINELVLEENFEPLQELRKMIRDSYGNFRSASHELSQRLFRDGRVEESGTVDEDRRTLQEEYETCRAKMQRLGLTGSSVAFSSYHGGSNRHLDELEETRSQLSHGSGQEDPPLLPHRPLGRPWSLMDLRQPLRARTSFEHLPRRLALPPSAAPQRNEGEPPRLSPTETPRRGAATTTGLLPFSPSPTQNPDGASAPQRDRERPAHSERPPFSTIPRLEPDHTVGKRHPFEANHRGSEPHQTSILYPEPIRNDAVREGIRADLIRVQESNVKFDGKNPEEFYSWSEQLWSRIVAAGLEHHPKEQIFILRSNTTGPPHRMISNWINSGLDDPPTTLHKVWSHLQTFYGSNDIIAASVRKRIERLKKIGREEDSAASSAMQDLHGLCLLVDNLQHKCLSLRHYSSPEGMRILWEKLPENLLRRWRGYYQEKSEHGEVKLKDFISELEKYIKYTANPLFSESETRGGGRAKVLRTEIQNEGRIQTDFTSRGTRSGRTNAPVESSWGSRSPEGKRTAEKKVVPARCPMHPGENNHGIADCGALRRKTLEERKKWAHENFRCFNCLEKHLVRFCRNDARCAKCGGRHITLMHDPAYHKEGRSAPEREKGFSTKNLRTAASGEPHGPQVYSKTLPVVIRTSDGGKQLDCLAVIDEQSTHTFVDERIMKLLKVPVSSITERPYRLQTMNQLDSVVPGKEISGLEVRGIAERKWLRLPPSLSHPGLPDTRSEMASPTAVRGLSHAKRYRKNFPEVDGTLEVMVLIGANCGKAMFTRCYGTTAPFVHRTHLGYALVGPTGSEANPSAIKVLRTGVQWRARTGLPDRSAMPEGPSDLFKERPDDDLPGFSKEDEEFNSIVSNGIRINEEGKIEIPLPFKPGAEVPENRLAVYHRSKNTLSRLGKDPETKVKCTEIMGNYLEKGHVRQLPPAEAALARNFIPVFLVNNVKKGKLRPVFDSAAKYKGRSFNDCLLQGPDANNKLVGILLRFRHHEVAFAADIEAMFHCFAVPVEHRLKQCFYWYQDNNPENPIVPFTANVHVFGHTSSPSVATFGLRYASSQDNEPERAKARHFINRHFYVDDGLSSEASVNDAIATLKGARQILAKYGIRLHKIVSTHQKVKNAFPPSELSEEPTPVTFGDTGTQKALGVAWDVESDDLFLLSDFKEVPFTKRGILSAIGSIFDPLGIVAPICLTGKLLQRKILRSTDGSGEARGWDDKLPEDFRAAWEDWIEEIRGLSSIRLRRTYRPHGFGTPRRSELHVFSDASQDSIGYVLYLRQFGDGADVSVAFVFGNSRVAPRSATSIPRLELCAAVAAAQCAQYVLQELDLEIDLVKYYTDSLVVKGYLENRTRRFTRYVTARVNQVLSSSASDQWAYIPSEMNPADAATRGHTPKELIASSWQCGPKFLQTDGSIEELGGGDVPAELPETVIDSKALSTKVGPPNSVLQHLANISSWERMMRTMTKVIIAVQKFKKGRAYTEDASSQARRFILQEVQRKGFPEVYESLAAKRPIQKEDKMLPLNPWMDAEGLIRVGGRLQRSDLPTEEKHPILLPPKEPITRAILAHHHGKSMHQGRHLTTAALRRAGFHIMNPRNVITSLLANCVICRRLRRKPEDQQMAQLPRARTERTAPFEHSGMDIFGPYHITDGKSTRRTVATKKVWVLIITCFYSRAVHLEVIGSMDTPTLLLAFRRFTALRGTCHRIWTDRGTNFAGAANQMENGIDLDALRDGLSSKGCTWEFTPTAAPHMGGVWERMVGSVKRVLDATLLLLKTRHLSRDEFNTVLQEASAIVNHTPLREISCDPTEPFPVSPAMLLNLRESTCGPQQETSEKDLLSYGSRRWRRVQHLSEQFWIGWQKDYLAKQQARAKWLRPKRNLMVGDVVLMRERTPRMSWPMAIVEETKPGEDGLVRKVVVKLKPTPQGRMQHKEKAVHDLVLLVPAETTSVSPGSVTATP